MKTRGTLAAGLSLALLTLPMIGCGSNNNSSGTLTTVQSEEATNDIFEAMADAEAGVGLLRAGTGNTEVQGIHNAHPSDSPLPPSLAAPKAVNPFSSTSLGTYTWNCPSGGDIVVTGSYSGTDTSASVTVTEAINSCQDSGFTINGNPNVTISDSYVETTSTFTDNASITGGFTVKGGGSCSMNVTETFTENINSGVYSGSITGSICGENLNYTYN
jgi:hypothetical protein